MKYTLDKVSRDLLTLDVNLTSVFLNGASFMRSLQYDNNGANDHGCTD